MLMVYISVRVYVRVRHYIYGVGFGVAVWMKKAIPEPRLAEQQDCSPAFVLYVCIDIAGKNMIFDILDYRKK